MKNKKRKEIKRLFGFAWIVFDFVWVVCFLCLVVYWVLNFF